MHHKPETQNPTPPSYAKLWQVPDERTLPSSALSGMFFVFFFLRGGRGGRRGGGGGWGFGFRALGS